MNTQIDTTSLAAFFDTADVVHTYSRAQMLQDGFLLDVTDEARQAGFRVPVAVSRAVWIDCIEWSAEDNQTQIQ